MGHRTINNYKFAVKLQIDQMMRNRNFRGRNDVVERGSITKSQKGNKAFDERKVGECFSGKHTDNVPKETHVVSVMTPKPLETRAEVRDEKGDRLPQHPIERQNGLAARNKNPHRDQAINRKTRETRVTFHADSNSVKIRPVDSGILPCVRTTSLKRLCTWRQMTFPTCWGRRKAQQEVEERWCARISCDSKGFSNWVVYHKILIRGSLFYVNKENWYQSTPSNSRTWHQIKIRERKGPSRGIIKKCAPHERCPCAPNSEDRSHEEILHQEKCAFKTARDWRKIIASSRIRTKLRFTLLLKPGQCRRPLQRDQKHENS